MALFKDWTKPQAPRSGLICSADNDGDGGGGGGGGGDDTISQSTRDLIMRTVNAAVTSQLGRKLPEAIKDGMGEALSPLQDQLKAIAEGKGGGTSGGTGGGGEAGKRGGDPQVGELQNQVKALTAQIQNEKEARKSEAEKHAAAALDADLRNALAKAGVRQELMDGAVATIKGNVTRGDDGGTIWRMQRQGYHEDLQLADGIKEWLGTDTGKAYQAPVDVSGSGQKPGAGGGPRPGGTPPDPATQKLEGKKKALDTLSGQIKDMLSAGTVEL